MGSYRSPVDKLYRCQWARDEPAATRLTGTAPASLSDDAVTSPAATTHLCTGKTGADRAPSSRHTCHPWRFGRSWCRTGRWMRPASEVERPHAARHTHCHIPSVFPTQHARLIQRQAITSAVTGHISHSNDKLHQNSSTNVWVIMLKDKHINPLSFNQKPN